MLAGGDRMHAEVEEVPAIPASEYKMPASLTKMHAEVDRVWKKWKKNAWQCWRKCEEC